MKMPNQHTQRGAVLIVGLILLIVVTVVAVSAIRLTNTQQILAGGMQQQMTVFQAAESMIRQVVAEIMDPNPPAGGGDHVLVESINNNLAGNPPPRRNLPNFQADVNAFADVVYIGQTNAPSSSIAVGNPFVAVVQRFQIDSTATMPTENSQANHIQGMKRLGPSGGS